MNKEKETIQTQVKEITMDDLKGIIKDGVNEILPDFKSEVLKEIKTGVRDKKEDTTEEKMVKAAKFIQDVCLGNVDEKAVDSSNASFGHTVPTELADFILTKRDKISKMRKLSFVFKLSGEFKLPLEGTGVIAYWVDENEEITESNPTISKKNLYDYYLATRVLIPRKLLNTSAFNIINFIGELCSRKMRDVEEQSFVAGDGAGKPTGLRSAGFSEIAQEKVKFSYDDLVNLFYELPEQYRQNAVFMTSSEGMKLLRKLKDLNDLPIFDVRDQTVFNRPVYESVDIPSNLGAGGDETEIMLFDPWYYWIKDGEQMFVDTDKIISKLQTELVVAEAIDGVYTLPDAGKKLTGVVDASV
ncbi:MAG: phage major capsid protein [Patescibacteria group bacterium]|jgi:HK97 family phage major capsid protein|nr:phage major capsid protein [Patescibacteria group bacterium]